MQKQLFIFLLLFFPLLTQGQKDSTILLKIVEINSVRLYSKATGFSEMKIDSNTISKTKDQSLSTLLSQNSSAFIKNYGPGALSSITLRGGSAYHTLVLWNGFSLANPMNGVMDVSLIPLSLFENISIQYGGASSQWGSGAISGAIHLNDNNTINQRNSIRVGTRFNTSTGLVSFGSIGFGSTKFSSTLKYFQVNEDNKYKYEFNGLNKIQTHANNKGYGIISENTYLFNANTNISLNFWHQYSNRQIAPLATQINSTAVQRDNNLRYVLIFKTTNKRSGFIFRNAFFNESIYYNDNSLLYPSLSLCKTFTSEPEYTLSINNFHTIQAGLNLTNTSAISTEYRDKKTISREAIFLSYKFSKNNFSASTSVRKEYSNLNTAPLTYSIGLEQTLTNWLYYSGNFNTIYRNPQINDLYWNPGGNINLLPESGQSEEGTLSIDVIRLLGFSKNNSTRVSFESTFFNKNIDNWIAWTPRGNIWYPMNIKSVHSYGSETFIHLLKKNKLFSTKTDLFYAYTISETTSSLIGNDASVNKQLIYVPIHKAGFIFSLEYKYLSLTYYFTYTGNRFTSTDNLEFLIANKIHSFQIDYYFKIKNNQFTLFTRIDNLFNEKYFAVSNRPQPLRNYGFGITMQFNKNNQK